MRYRITIHFCVCCTALLTQVVSIPTLLAGSRDRPNLVLILADDLGYGDVAFHGQSDVQTPHLDQLASDGMMFTRMRANCTVCSPTRAAILSGIYADRAGVPGVIRTHRSDSWGFFDPSIDTLADRLKAVGYDTAIVGKWHLGLEFPNHPNERGFDHFHGFLGDMMDDYLTHRRFGINYMRLNQQEIDPVGHATDLFTDWAIDYVQSQSSRKRPTKNRAPFFLYLAYNAPHFPIQPTPEWLQKVKQRSPGLSEKRAKNVAFVEHLDHSIGRFLQQLDQLGLRENTMVVFTSDNGGHLGSAQSNAPWRGGKQSHYDGGLRVPFLMRYPGCIQPASRSDYAGLTFDVFPTFLELAGARVPKDSDAVSLSEIASGQVSESKTTERELYFVRREGNMTYVGQAYHALIRGKWKLMQNDPYSPLELYDLEADPQETTNVIDEHPEVVRALKAALASHIQAGGSTPWQPFAENESAEK